MNRLLAFPSLAFSLENKTKNGNLYKDKKHAIFNFNSHIIFLLIFSYFFSFTLTLANSEMIAPLSWQISAYMSIAFNWDYRKYSLLLSVPTLKTFLGTGKKTQLLRALNISPEDTGLVSNTHMAVHSHPLPLFQLIWYLFLTSIGTRNAFMTHI